MHKNLLVSILIFLTGANEMPPNKFLNNNKLKNLNEELFEDSIVEFF